MNLLRLISKYFSLIGIVYKLPSVIENDELFSEKYKKNEEVLLFVL